MYHSLQMQEISPDKNGTTSICTAPSLWADPQAAKVCLALLLAAPVSCSLQRLHTSSCAPVSACHVSTCLTR